MHDSSVLSCRFPAAFPPAPSAQSHAQVVNGGKKGLTSSVELAMDIAMQGAYLPGMDCACLNQTAMTILMSGHDVIYQGLDQPKIVCSAGVEIIAEPGRYFAEAPFTLGCMVFGDREGQTPAGKACYDYWITDGLYGAMNSLLYDHATLFVNPLEQPNHADKGEATSSG